MRKGKIGTIEKWRVLFSVLSAALILFIFSNSWQTGEVSGQVSGTLTKLLKHFLDPWDRLDFDVFHHFIRKLAHFSEYAALGFNLMGLSQTVRWKKRWGCFAFPLLTALAVAIIDECIQFFSDGRTPSAWDCMIDFCGAAFGTLIFWGITQILLGFCKRKNR